MAASRGVTMNSGILAWQRLKKSISNTEPKDTVKFIVILVCLILVYVQVMACFEKLENPAVTSHTELKQNETMSYPSLTICREPPFNRRYYAKYNIDNPHLASVPLVSQWSKFPFENYTIQSFFDDATYTDKVFVSYGLSDNINGSWMSSSLHLTLGLCHTIIPLNITRLVGKRYGYSVTLQHDMYDFKPVLDETPGWYIYIHEPHEKFSENTELLAGRQDHLFVRVGEEIEVNLEAIEFQTIRNCNNSHKYSSTECEEKCWVESIHQQVNCTGPWFPWVKLPYCNNYRNFSVLHKLSTQMMYLNCCLPHCMTKQYTTSVVSRIDLGQSLRSTVYVYFTSKSILVMEESYAYDWNLFIADLGGSLGFLLGLSVLGVVSILEQIVKIIWGGRDKKKQDDDGTKNVVACPYHWKFDSHFKISPTVVAKFDRY